MLRPQQRRGARRSAAAQSRRIYAEQSGTAVTQEHRFQHQPARFLKKVGITSQREIEKAVCDAVASGRLKGNGKLPAKMVLTVGGVNPTHEITDGIGLG